MLVFRLAVGHLVLLNYAFSAPTWNRSVFKTGVKGITREDTGNLGQETLHCTDRYAVFFILHPSNHILHLSMREKEMQVNKNICAFDAAATWDENKNSNQCQYSIS